ncbi:hypothetical protein PVK06_007222 [Gossypium arboreum]|uniref:Uncharacterized protein n=1 Tax=Gossypium arboreum TaxID=29729 RepID=A0ABR0QHV0_GOSAR|nr:hypothetical protein PVK06_007222 [Gossypium arboreum]
MDRTVSRRSEPSSRTALMGKQPNPWNILQPQVAKSRHREWYLTDGSGPPEGGLLRLPPKLRRKSPKPIPGNSEAS